MRSLTLALIGGGRWGRTHASVLVQLSDRVGRVVWVSRHNRGASEAFLAGHPGLGERFLLVGSLDAALAERPDAAIVVTPAADHAPTVEALLTNGVPVLVEKPLALSVETARHLVDLAARREIPLCVGLHLLEAKFLHHFLRLLAGRRIAAVELEWLDPATETRRNDVKSSNLTTHKVDEIIPHLWSILRLIDEEEEPRLGMVKPLARGAVEVEVSLRQSRARLRFGRRAVARSRWIRLGFGDGGSAELDYGIEPGRIIIDGIDQPRLEWDGKVGPLATEIVGFLDIVRSKRKAMLSPQLALRCIGSVELAEAVRIRLTEEEASAAAARLSSGGTVRDPDVSAWIVDNIAPSLDLHEPALDHQKQELVELILDAAEMASGNVRTRTRSQSEALDSMVASVRQTRFFGLLQSRLERGAEVS
jgi:Oxidoreductase family, NAD-binding Rossmann fold